MKRFSVEAVSVENILEAMDSDGVCIVEGMLGPDEVLAGRASLAGILEATPRGRNDFEGFTTRRVYALFAKTRAFDQAALNPLVLGVLDRALGHYQLSAPVGIEICPGEKAQVLHKDQGVYPLPTSFPDVVVNTIWALDDFTEANGATRFILGSHRLEDRPGESQEPVCAVMPAGSTAFYVGKLWHGGGANTTDRARLGVILEYVAAWLRPQENHILGVPRETVASLPERLQELLGYNIFPPFVGYVDGRHPRRFIAK